VVHASVAIFDSVHRRLRGRLALVRSLVWPRSKKAFSMKSSGFSCLVRKWTLVGLLFLALLSWLLFHTRINHELSLHFFLNSENPREELFEELVTRSENPLDFLQRAWRTGKVVHRQFVANYLKESASRKPTWFAHAESLLISCVTDADASVRELGLAAMEACHNPHLIEAAQFQLNDLDPLVRQLGLGYLRKSDSHKALPMLIRLLDDPDLRIVTEAEVGLTRSTGEDFGIRTRMAIPQALALRASEIEQSVAETIHNGVEKRKEWWKAHKDEYASDSDSKQLFTFPAEAERPPASDFKLSDLNGNTVRLSDFKGKIVLINFWATWCTACLAEIPDLIALQKKVDHQVAILGVALDGVPDDHGDLTGEDGHEKSRAHGTSSKAVRAKVERAVKARQINYPILLDDKNSAGGQYNGGELPTNVIIDTQGRVRRRFIGERSLAVFESMVTEAQKPQ
jgi:thiol-disulfide isomerase/thioredoxin